LTKDRVRDSRRHQGVDKQKSFPPREGTWHHKAGPCGKGGRQHGNGRIRTKKRGGGQVKRESDLRRTKRPLLLLGYYFGSTEPTRERSRAKGRERTRKGEGCTVAKIARVFASMAQLSIHKKGAGQCRGNEGLSRAGTEGRRKR